MGYIYLRKNLTNGKCYVGQTDNIKERNYKWNCLNARYGGYAINNARAKYGADGFSFEILKECPNEEMNYWEKYYVKELNSKVPYGYNMTDGGDSRCEMTEETKKKMSAAHKGTKHSEKTKLKIGVASRGRKHSEEAKKKIGDAHRGRKLSPEHIAKVSAAHKGMKQSEEHKAKLSAAQKNNPKKSKVVQALNKVTGEVVYEFPSTQEAQRQGFTASAVSRCCRNCFIRPGNNVYKGFIWRYAEK